MGITVSDEILKRTTKCEKTFACLSGRMQDRCKAERSYNGVLLIQPKNGNSCGYHVDLGKSDFCTCPVRVELYKAYGI